MNGDFLLDISARIGPRAPTAQSADPPGPTVTVHPPIPVRDGDTISPLGFNGRPVQWSKAAGGSLVIDVPAAAVQSGHYARVFKIDWNS